jgi:hypothetical protein
VKVPASRALIVLGLLHAALQHQRHQILFAVIAPLVLAEPLSLNLAKTSSRLGGRKLAAELSIGAITLVLGLTASRFLFPVARSDSPVAPIAALEHVPASLRAQPVLNEYGFGGYLIFNGVRPFIDSRAELYGDEFLQQYARIIRPDSAAVNLAIRANGIRWTILGAHSPAVFVMDAMAGWHRLYSDNFAVVHVRDN